MKTMQKLWVMSLLAVLLLSACNLPLGGNVERTPTRISEEATGAVQPVASLPTATPEPEAQPTIQPTVPRVDPTPVATRPAPVVVEPAPAQPTRAPATQNLNSFGQKLASAVESRNFSAMRALMGDRFSIATFNTQLMNYDSAEALDLLRGDKFAPGSAPAVRFGTDVVMLLNGSDPLGLWGPVADPVRAMHVMGLASSGNEEGVLVIGRENGKFIWLGILLPENRFFRGEGPEDVVETDVQWVEALEEVNARSGPGLNYAVEGRVRQGEVAQVTGITASGQWWRISCTQDSSGHCWISASPDLTRPVSAP